MLLPLPGVECYHRALLKGRDGRRETASAAELAWMVPRSFLQPHGRFLDTRDQRRFPGDQEREIPDPIDGLPSYP
jgi:hypothetical protein